MFQTVRKQMAFEVIHANEGFIERKGQSFGHAESDEERSGQAGAIGHREAVDLFGFEMRVFQRLGDHRGNQLNVRA